MSELKPVNLSNLERFLANIKDKFLQIKDAVLTVNSTGPDAFGNVQINRVNLAGDLESTSTQANSGEFIVRTSGGEASINSGEARLLSVRGRAVHTGYESDEARGTITVSTPSRFVSTGWNLYQHDDSYTGYTGYARVINYGGDFRVAGSYGTLKFSDSLDGSRSDLAVSSGKITGFPANWTEGYIWASEGNSTNTEIYLAWGDWAGGYSGAYAAYSETVIDFSELFGSGHAFPYGLLQVGSAYDEIDLTAENGGQAISRIDRLDYNETNLATAQSSGREWDADEDYIYLVKANPDITTDLGISNAYTANDHGMELFEDTEVPVYASCNYGASLRNKLERDVLTISQQTLSAAQQNQVRKNIGAASEAAVSGIKYAAFESKLLESVGTSYDSANQLKFEDKVITGANFKNGHFLIYLCGSYANGRGAAYMLMCGPSASQHADWKIGSSDTSNPIPEIGYTSAGTPYAHWSSSSGNIYVHIFRLS